MLPGVPRDRASAETGQPAADPVGQDRPRQGNAPDLAGWESPVAGRFIKKCQLDVCHVLGAGWAGCPDRVSSQGP